MNETTVPIFPLHSVLFPGGVLPLRIFEPRYLDMVSNCMKSGSSFGICLIKEGSEVGDAALSYNIGTLATIDYWHMRTDGILGVTAHGMSRFNILTSQVQDDNLSVAAIEIIEDEAPVPMPAEYARLSDMLKHIINQLGYPFMRLKMEYDNASWVGSRLTELLPIPLDQKQLCLEMSDPVKRLEHLSMLIKDI